MTEDFSSPDAGHVRYEVSCPALADLLQLERFEAAEEVGRPYRISALLRTTEMHIDLMGPRSIGANP